MKTKLLIILLVTMLCIGIANAQRVEKTEYNYTFDGGSDEGFVKSYPESATGDFSNNDFRTSTTARATYGKNVSLDHNQGFTFIGDLYLDTSIGRFGWFAVNDKVETSETNFITNSDLLVQLDARNTPTFIIWQDGVVLNTCTNIVFTQGNGGKYEVQLDYDSATQVVDLYVEGSLECSVTLPNPLTEADDWVHFMSYYNSAPYRSWWDNLYVAWNKLNINTDMVALTDVGSETSFIVNYNGTLTSDVTNTTFDCSLVADGVVDQTDIVTITGNNQFNYTWSNLAELDKGLNIYCENDETNATTDVYTYTRYNVFDVLATDSFHYPKLENLDDELDWIEVQKRGTGSFVSAKIDLGYNSPPDVDNRLCYGDYCQQQVPEMEFFYTNKTTINFWMYVDDFNAHAFGQMALITGTPQDGVSCASAINQWSLAFYNVGQNNVGGSIPSGDEWMGLWAMSRASPSSPPDAGELYIQDVMRGRWEEDRWYMVTVIHDPTTYEAWIYVDGVLEGYTKNTAPINPYVYENVDCPYAIGGRPSPEYGLFTFAGTVDEITIWNGNLEHYELNQLYNNDTGVQDIRDVKTALYLNHTMRDRLRYFNENLSISYYGFPVNDFSANRDIFNCTLEVNGVVNLTDSDINITQTQTFDYGFGKIEEEVGFEIKCANYLNGGESGVFTYRVDTLDPRIVTNFTNNTEFYQGLMNVTVDVSFHNDNLQDYNVTVKDSVGNVELNFYENVTGQNLTYAMYYTVIPAENFTLDNYTLTLYASDEVLESEEVYDFEVTECREFWVAETTSCSIFGDQVLYYVDVNGCSNAVPIVPIPNDNSTTLSCEYATEECGTNEITVTGNGQNKKWTIGNDCVEVDMWLTKYSHQVVGRDLCCDQQFKLWWFGIEERDITTGQFVRFRHFNTFDFVPDISEGYLKYVSENATLSYLVNTSTLKTQLELTNYSYTNNNTELWVKIMEQKNDDDRVVFVAPFVDSVEQPIVVERTLERGDNFVYQKLGRGEHIDVDPIFYVHGAIMLTPFTATHDASDIGSVIIDFIVEFGVQLLAFAGLIALVGLYIVFRKRLK